MNTNPPHPTSELRPVTLLICALGGEGGGVLTEWLIDIARASGYAAQSTSIPGVAQRTGATTYYLEVFPLPLAQLGGRRPVFSLNPVPGALDAMVSSELLETARQVGNGMSTATRTLVITSSDRTLTTAERMVPGDGRSGGAPLLQAVRAHSREHHVLPMAAMARECGTAVSAVMLGAIAGSGVLPFTREACETAIAHGGGAAARMSQRGFARAFEQVATQRARAQALREAVEPASASATATATANTTADSAVQEQPPSATAAWLAEFPEPARDMLALGHARLLDYQGTAYAQLYLQRMRQVLQAECEADPAGAHGHETTRETARWLALWMAFDDIVRVADLKSRASRWQRVRGEVKATDADLLKVYDHFKPGAPEFAALLPAPLANRVLQWDRRRVARGREPWALPLKVGTHTVLGMLSLRVLASLKWLRPRGHRYAQEQAMIGRWLAGVLRGTREHWALGHEVALCGRLIKGYGTTNERGKDNLLHVLDHLAQAATMPGAPARAAAIAAARSAALADDAGHALDAALAQHGAPARPVKEQPIRWVKTHPGKQPSRSRIPA